MKRPDYQPCDGDRAKCPHCGDTFGDLWEYGDKPGDDDLEIECPCCGKPLHLSRIVTVEYEIAKRDVPNET